MALNGHFDIKIVARGIIINSSFHYSPCSLIVWTRCWNENCNNSHKFSSFLALLLNNGLWGGGEAWMKLFNHLNSWNTGDNLCKSQDHRETISSYKCLQDNLHPGQRRVHNVQCSHPIIGSMVLHVKGKWPVTVLVHLELGLSQSGNHCHPQWIEQTHVYLNTWSFCWQKCLLHIFEAKTHSMYFLFFETFLRFSLYGCWLLNSYSRVESHNLTPGFLYEYCVKRGHWLPHTLLNW